jgi:N-acetyl-gamma-glutamyl-phosphate reductase
MHVLLGGSSYSSYLEGITTALRALLPAEVVRVTTDLAHTHPNALSADGVTHLIWCLESGDGSEQLLRLARLRIPGLVLVTIGTPADGASRSDMCSFMQKLRSEMHVCIMPGENTMTSTVLTVQGDILLDNAPSAFEVARCIATHFLDMRALTFPIRKKPVPTEDRESFLERDLRLETEIPFGNHPGAFGVTRRHHTHEGVDLYGFAGDVVSAMESGCVIAIRPFTGAAIGSPHWADTQCILVEGRSGVLNYGEITVDSHLSVGASVVAGQTLGVLATVLLVNKGRPDTMLHLERYVRGTSVPILEWPLDTAQPEALLDPTPLLVQAGELDLRATICIIGQRGLVSQRMQAALSRFPQLAFVVVSTDEVLHGGTHRSVVSADLVVLCTREDDSVRVFKTLPPGSRVLDMSPAFREDPEWVYGLPELAGGTTAIRAAERVSNPGCFATAAMLLLEPLVRNGALRPETPLYLDGTGGFTTGGASMVERHRAGELPADCAFSLSREHRHIAEVKRHARLTGPVVFTPKVAAVAEGIRMQVALFDVSRENALKVYHDVYRGTDIVVDSGRPSRLPVDEWAGKTGACLRVYDREEGCVVVATMDNMGKGSIDAAMTNIVLMLSDTRFRVASLGGTETTS